MQRAENKVYLKIKGKPILCYSLEKFTLCELIDEIVVVTREDDLSLFKEILDNYNFKKEIKVTIGGRLRQDSALKGLHAFEEAGPDIVLVHDAARPFFSSKLVERLIEAAKEHGAAIPALPLKDTIKEVREGFVERDLDRSKLFSIQTPQCFSYSLLRYCTDEATKAGLYFTDDAGAVYSIGGVKPKVIEGEETNIKITTPMDIWLAERIAGMI